MAYYTDSELDQIWSATTRPLEGLMFLDHANDARLDELGNVVYRSRYGKADLPYGWEVDHRNALALGGLHHLSNLRALSCRANRGLGGLIGNLLNTLNDPK